MTERRTAADFANFLRWVAGGVYVEAERVALVTDNLNIRTSGPLYEAFKPPGDRRLGERIEWHYTPTHGSWLNVAECEFAALTRQCLGRRIGSIGELRRQVDAWVDDRNHRGVLVRWQFTAVDARPKLRRLYPSIQ